MKAIPIPFTIKRETSLFSVVGLILGTRTTQPSDYEPDAGYVFFLIDPVWCSNMDDKYRYRFVRKHFYKRFTNKYYDKLDKQCRPDWAGEQYGIFKTYENQIKFYKTQPKFYWGKT